MFTFPSFKVPYQQYFSAEQFKFTFPSFKEPLHIMKVGVEVLPENIEDHL